MEQKVAFNYRMGERSGSPGPSRRAAVVQETLEDWGAFVGSTFFLRQTEGPPAFVILLQRQATLQIGHIKRAFSCARKKLATELRENTERGRDHATFAKVDRKRGSAWAMVGSWMLQHR